MSNYLLGIDLSEHNGDINWTKVKSSGIQFSMLRAGYGKGVIDKKFLRNISECNRVGIPVGIYWFSYAVNETEAANEAQHCIQAIKPYKIELPVAYDFEYDSVNNAKKRGVAITKSLASKMAKTFLTEIQAAGYQPANYTNPDFLNRYFDDSVRFPVWLAQWPSGTPNLYAPPYNCLMWQYSAKGSVNGIVGDVDCNAYYGKLQEKKKLTDWEIVQQKAGLSDSTMKFLDCYKYGDDLIRKLASAMRE